MSKTVIDQLAARMTGIQLAAKFSENALYAAHMAHPEIDALREGFLAAYVNKIVKEPA